MIRPPPIRPWPLLESRQEEDYQIFRLRRDRALNPRTELPLDVFVLETPDWVNVVPVTPAGDLVLVRQFRHGIRRVTLEIPGGVVDPEDGDPAVTAGRELREETGYQAGAIVHLGTVQAQPAYQDNLCHTYLALDACPVGAPTPDEGEDLGVELVSLDSVPERVRSGEIAHGLVVAALYWYELWRRAQGDSG